jgi:hypothetical protein
MPQLVGLVVVGAGLYAAYKALGRMVQQVAVQATRAEEELRRRTAAAGAIEKDLGALEWDEVQQVYRPKQIG